MKRSMFLSVATLLAAGLMSYRPASEGYNVGDTVQNFSLKNVDGKTVSLTDHKDVKGYIVVFTCNTCPVARAYESRIMDLNDEFAPKGYPVLAIQSNDAQRSPGDSYAAMQQRATSKKYAFPYLYDENQAVARMFGARNTPHVFVVQHEGSQYNVAYIGAIDNNQNDPASADKKFVATAVNELLAGKPVSTPTARAIGCGIRWKNV